MIDAFSFGVGFNLNYYKIFALVGIGHLKPTPFEKKVLIFLLGFTFASGLMFICIHPELKDPLSDSFLNLPIIRIFRNQFTLITSFILGYFLFLEMKKEDALNRLLKALEIVGIITSLAIIIEMIFSINLYSIATGTDSVKYGSMSYGSEYLRAKGIAYEPRGAAQVLTASLLAVICHSSYKKFFPLIILFCVALLNTYSFSGMVMSFTLMGIVFLRSLLVKDLKVALKGILALLVLTIGVFVFMKKNEVLQKNIKLRSFVYEKPAPVAHNTENPIINRLEVFDAAYVNFLFHEPFFLPFGTGSGMAGFASQKYVLEKDKWDFPNGSTAAPLMGAVFLISQFGIVVSLGMVIVAIKGLIFTRDNKKFFSLILVLLFLLQYYYYFVFFIAVFIMQLNEQRNHRIKTLTC